MRNKLKKAVILLIWLLIWQVTALIVNNPIYFASPLETAAELVNKIGQPLFWRSVGGSLIRIFAGFATASVLAFAAAFATLRYKWLGDFISPFVTFIKSVPVAAVAVILLIWWGPRYLVLCISLMVVFPNIYSNMQMGLNGADKGLLEMASVFDIRARDRFLWIYRPAYIPYLHSAVSVAIGMCFKSGIAAEVIGLPEFSAGEQLYRDKIYLNTAGVFAWVVVVLILSAVVERLIVFGLKKLAAFPDACPDEDRIHTVSGELNTIREHGGNTVFSEGLLKSYAERVIVDTRLSLEEGGIYYLMAPSGAGKTTLLKMIAGIISPDKGSVSAGRISMVFQDDRLVEGANAFRNLQTAGCTGDLAFELMRLLPKEALQLRASDLSGGERRRLAIARAILHPSDIVIMDEPFAGLDEETKQITIKWIMKHLEGRTLLLTAHEADEVGFEGAKMIGLKD